MYLKLKRNKIFWHYIIAGKNGEIVMASENFFSKSNAKRAANRAAAALGLDIK